MNKLLSFLMLVSLAFIYSCGSDDDGAPANINTATVGGQTFAPTTSSATSTSTGLNIKLADGTKEIMVNLDDKISGTYSITTIVPSGRTAALTGSGSYSDGSKVYYAVSGQVIVTVGTDGKASGTFILSGKASDGTTIELKDGKFTGLSIGTPPTNQCLVSKISEGGGGYVVTYDYDGDGRLISRYETDGPTYSGKSYYYYSGGLLTSVTRTTKDGSQTATYQEQWTYTNGKVTRIERKRNSALQDQYIIEYNGSGLPIKVTWKGTYQSFSYTGVSDLTYDGSGNVTKLVYTETETGSGSSTGTSTFTYDTNSNPLKLLAQAIRQPNFTHEIYESVGEEFSKNNVIKYTYVSSDGDTYTNTNSYIYNAKGYPTRITNTEIYSGTTYTDVSNIEYIGCN